MKVYGHPMSGCTRAVLTTLAEKGHEAQFVLVDLMKGEHKQPAHVARQPFGVVPAFEDAEVGMLYESRAIMRYLDRKLSGPSLTPTDARGYGLMEQYISVEHSYFTPAAGKVFFERLFKPHMGGGAPDEARIAEGFKGVEQVFAVIDPVLGKQQYLAGDSFSLAEVSWMPYMEFFAVSGGVELINQHKNVAAWWNRVSSRPSWKKVVGR
ncbi:glutathione binding-like protein [Pyxidicoccus trucidator]|uniref:glutathione binding-like protein n=1 Tax=Pyxidicoccus trucidator TaxID=2709662 RepID=UPI0013DD38A6|nr:glutathione binding-like protein [Pyxidicoccus trucidator]